MSSPTITITPEDGALGVSIEQDIVITFDTSIDIGSILSGSIIVTGVIDQLWSGPDMIMFEQLTSNSYNPYLLSAPTLTGVLDYDINIARVDSNGNIVSITDDGTDINSGNLFYTRVTLSPKNTSKENTKYGVVISSDITLNTIFDPVYSFNAASSGLVAFYGPYEGSITDQYVVTITSGTTYSNLTFEWYKTSNPAAVTTVNSANKREVYLDNNVKIVFDTGTFTVGDQVTANVRPIDSLESIYTSSFITGIGVFQTPESGESRTLDEIDFISNIGSINSQSTSCVNVISTSPADEQYQVLTSTSEIIIKFESDIDSNSFDLSKLKIQQEQLIPTDIFCSTPTFLTTLTPSSTTISGSELHISISGLLPSSVVTIELGAGAITSSNVGSCKYSGVFLTAFPYFFTTPSYIAHRGGGVMDAVPDILLAEKIGILSTNLQMLLVNCFKTMCNQPSDFKAYYGTMIRDYVSNTAVLEILQNSNRLTSMSKAIDTFKVSFGSTGIGGTSGQSGVMYDALKKDTDDLLRAIRSCGKIGPGQSLAPGTFEKSATSEAPAVRGRNNYVNSNIPGLNTTVRTVSTRQRVWRNRNGY